MLDGLCDLSVINMGDMRLDVFSRQENRSPLSWTNRQNVNIVGRV
jgi:hypothetical protein